MTSSRDGERSPSKRAHVVRVLSVPFGQSCTVRFLGSVRGLLTHWHSGRSVPCAGVSECPLSLHRSRTVWKGYAPVEQWHPVERHWLASVLEVTEYLEETLRSRELRGEVWILTREGAGEKSSPVTGAYCETQPPDKVSPAFDVEPVLLRFFHLQSLKLDVPNPLPGKLLCEPCLGDAPNIPADLLPEKVQEQTPEDRSRVKELLDKMRKATRNGS